MSSKHILPLLLLAFISLAETSLGAGKSSETAQRSPWCQLLLYSLDLQAVGRKCLSFFNKTFHLESN